MDSPGVLSGDQQRLGRSYDYGKVCEWWAERADMILLLFDAHKLDISDELKHVIEALKGQDDKIRIVLNKADVVNSQQLMRVYGALMWSLGKVIQTPEVIRVYIGSFRAAAADDCPTAPSVDHHELLVSEHKDLLEELYNLPKNAAIRKVNDVIKRARLARVHAYILNHLRSQMPTVFGKSAKQERLIRHLAGEFTAVQRLYNLPIGDFPEYQRFQERLCSFSLDNVPKLSSKMMNGLETALTKDLPGLLEAFPQQPRLGLDRIVNPFTGDTASPGRVDGIGDFSTIDHEAHRKIFITLCPKKELLSGPEGRLLFSESGLSFKDLGHIWSLADTDHDGSLSFDEFSIAMHLIKVRKAGLELPEALPTGLWPK